MVSLRFTEQRTTGKTGARDTGAKNNSKDLPVTWEPYHGINYIPHCLLIIITKRAVGVNTPQGRTLCLSDRT